MALDRQVPTSATPGAVDGDSYMDAVSEEITGLWDRSCILLENVAGTADVITADVTPDLVGSLVDGMGFILPVAATNTTAATLKIGSGSAKDVVRNNGDPSEAGDLTIDTKVPLIYDQANDVLVMLFGHTASLGADLDYQAFTASGTWTKPSGISADALVSVEMWGGGGGGGANATGGGGGGGAYARRILKASQLGATETVTIGAAGAVSGAGGDSSLGTLLVAYGGGGGANSAQGGGGGGGGAMGSGASGSAGNGGIGGLPLGGDDASAAAFNRNSVMGGGGGGTGGGTGNAGGYSYMGGGGGTAGDTGASGGGGNSLYGGAGGGAPTTGGAGGVSTFGGSGGNTGVAGTAPGGGGGRNAIGARGEVRVLVIG